MVEEQIIAALNRIAAAIEKSNAMQEQQKAKNDTKPSRKTFRYPPAQQATREYPQQEK